MQEKAIPGACHHLRNYRLDGSHDYVIHEDRLLLASHKQSASRSMPQDDTSGTPTVKGKPKEDAADQ